MRMQGHHLRQHPSRSNRQVRLGVSSHFPSRSKGNVCETWHVGMGNSPKIHERYLATDEIQRPTQRTPIDFFNSSIHSNVISWV